LDAECGPKAASLMDVVERDENSSNRVAALHAIQSIISSGAQAGFLAGAEEKSRLNAFTSLSSRMASIIVDLRRRLLAILTDKSTTPILLEAALKCTRTLVMSTPQVKLRISHSQMLREVTLKLCSRPEVTSAVPAYSLLSALVGNEKQGGEGSTSDSIMATLQDGKTPVQVQVEAWNTMTALAEKDAIQTSERKHIPDLLRLAVSPINKVELRQAAANFVQACKSSSGITLDAVTIDQLCRDDSPIVRSIAANCLVIGQDQNEQLSKMMQDLDSTVRASAARAVGVQAQEKSIDLEDQALRLLFDVSLLVRMRASWTLGNLCESSDRYPILLSHCLSLKGDDERVEVNAIRGVGAVLARCPTSIIKESQESVESALSWLLFALTSGGPKVRWNASASVARALTIESTGQFLLSLLDSRLLFVLAKVVVDDSTFKVRLSAVNALLILAERRSLNKNAVETVTKSTQEAIEKVEGQIKQASFREAQLHALPLQKLLERLLVLLQSDPNLQ